MLKGIATTSVRAALRQIKLHPAAVTTIATTSSTWTTSVHNATSVTLSERPVPKSNYRQRLPSATRAIKATAVRVRRKTHNKNKINELSTMSSFSNARNQVNREPTTHGDKRNSQLNSFFLISLCERIRDKKTAIRERRTTNKTINATVCFFSVITRMRRQPRLAIA